MFRKVVLYQTPRGPHIGFSTLRTTPDIRNIKIMMFSFYLESCNLDL